MTPQAEFLLEVESGMFWEWHPELTGNWNRDAEAWLAKKGYGNIANSIVEQQEEQSTENALATIRKVSETKMMVKQLNKVNNPIQPNYYKRTIRGVEIDVYDIARVWGLNAAQFNALKYVLRAGKKEGEPYEKDIAKAGESLERALDYGKKD